MFVSALLWVLAGFGFLITGLVSQEAMWAWGCIGCCTVAAVILLVDAVRRRRARSTVHTQVGVVDGAQAAGDERVDTETLTTVAASDQQVVVVDEAPLYHLAQCPAVEVARAITVSAREAVELGFQPCGRCSPARTVAAAERAYVPLAETG